MSHMAVMVRPPASTPPSGVVKAVDEEMVKYSCHTDDEGVPKEFEDRDAEIRCDYIHLVTTNLKPSLEDYARDHGYVLHEGRYGYWYNPNAKWDWFTIGGRWRGMLEVKLDTPLSDIVREGREYKHTEADGTRLKYIDHESMYKRLLKEANEFCDSWASLMFGKGNIAGVEVQTLHQAISLGLATPNEGIPEGKYRRCGGDYYKLSDVTKQDVIDKAVQAGRFATAAYVQDGNWVESDASLLKQASADWPTQQHEWMNNGNQDDWVVIVDVHY